MNALPTGTVTFLFADIEGSTALQREAPSRVSGRSRSFAGCFASRSRRTTVRSPTRSGTSTWPRSRTRLPRRCGARGPARAPRRRVAGGPGYEFVSASTRGRRRSARRATRDRRRPRCTDRECRPRRPDRRLGADARGARREPSRDLGEHRIEASLRRSAIVSSSPTTCRATSRLCGTPSRRSALASRSCSPTTPCSCARASRDCSRSRGSTSSRSRATPRTPPARGDAQADVAIVDIRMPPTHTDEGFRAAARSASGSPTPACSCSRSTSRPGYAMDLLSESAEGVGYLLKDRVADIEQFAAAVRRVAEGGSVLDPAVVSELRRSPPPGRPARRAHPREREVLELMAEGRSNQAIADRMFVTLRAVEKHVTSIFSKLDLPASTDDHRRVLAVLLFLRRVSCGREADAFRVVRDRVRASECRAAATGSAVTRTPRRLSAALCGARRESLRMQSNDPERNQMSPLKHSTNIAARMGRWSAGHRKTAIFGWLAFVVAAFAVGIGRPDADDRRDRLQRRRGPQGGPHHPRRRVRARRAVRVRARPVEDGDGRRSRVPRGRHRRRRRRSIASRR